MDFLRWLAGGRGGSTSEGNKESCLPFRLVMPIARFLLLFDFYFLVVFPRFQRDDRTEKCRTIVAVSYSLISVLVLSFRFNVFLSPHLIFFRNPESPRSPSSFLVFLSRFFIRFSQFSSDIPLQVQQLPYRRYFLRLEIRLRRFFSVYSVDLFAGAGLCRNANR